MSTREIWIAQRKVATDGSRYSRTAETIYLVRSRSKHFMENFEEISMFMLQKCSGFIKYNSVCNSYFCKCETASFSWEKKTGWHFYWMFGRNNDTTFWNVLNFTWVVTFLMWQTGSHLSISMQNFSKIKGSQ